MCPPREEVLDSPVRKVVPTVGPFAEKGLVFERQVLSRLRGLGFSSPSCHVRVIGQSGAKWNVDFLIEESRLVVEASTTRSGITAKIGHMFLKFVDITASNPSFRCALVLEGLEETTGHSGERAFPKACGIAMAYHGFPILTLLDIGFLCSFARGASAMQPGFPAHMGYRERRITEEYGFVPE